MIFLYHNQKFHLSYLEYTFLHISIKTELKSPKIMILPVNIYYLQIKIKW